jgi:hypothetical protein
LFSQAKQSIIGARFSSTKFTFFRRKGLLADFIVSPATIFQSHPPPVTTIHVLLNKFQWWLALHSHARPTANFHTQSLVLHLHHTLGRKFVDQKCGIRLSASFLHSTQAASTFAASADRVVAAIPITTGDSIAVVCAAPCTMATGSVTIALMTDTVGGV